MPDRRTRRSPEILNREICINYIINDKFPIADVSTYARGILIEECNDSHSDANEDIVSSEIMEFRKTLDRKSDGEILTLYRKTRDNRDLERNVENSNKEIFLFFNQPSAMADYEYWLDLDFWTADEAAALSIGRDPTVVNAQSMLGPLRSSPVRLKYRNRFDAVSAAITIGRLPEHFEPKLFIAWAIGKNWDLPDPIKELSLTPTRTELLQKIAELELKIDQLAHGQKSKKGISIDEMGTRAKQTFQKIILGLSIVEYDHNVGRNSRAAAAIEEALARSEYDELKVKRDTIRTILQEAALELDIS